MKWVMRPVTPAGRVGSSVEGERREVKAALLRVGIVTGDTVLVEEHPRGHRHGRSRCLRGCHPSGKHH